MLRNATNFLKLLLPTKLHCFALAKAVADAHRNEPAPQSIVVQVEVGLYSFRFKDTGSKHVAHAKVENRFAVHDFLAQA